MGRRRRIHSRLLQSVALIVVTSASVSVARAQTPNTTIANVNALNLLAPFLTLNATPVGQDTLQTSLHTVISINNNAPAAQVSLAISDALNLLSGVSKKVNTTPDPQYYGPAANLAGGLPPQAMVDNITPQQPVGGFGSVLGPIYQNGVCPNPNAPCTAPQLSNTVALLTTALDGFIGSDLDLAKYSFANGTTNGTVSAIAPPGYTLPTFNGLPNMTDSVYDLAYGVTNTQPCQIINGMEICQDKYGNSRPFQVAPTQVVQYYQLNVVEGGLTNDPAFPSGHTTYGYTDSILLAMLVPELYQSMMVRASEYGNDRLVVGAHHPTDVIGARALATYDLAQYLSNPAYINNAAVTGTAVDLPNLLTQAMPELRGYLSAQCGNTVAVCATSPQNTANNPYVPSAANQALYQYRLTYGLPTLSFAEAPREAAPAGAADASILLATLYGGSTAAAKQIAPNGGMLGSLQTSTINQIIINTETNALAAYYGSPLSYWTRIDLYSAAGYFDNVTGVLPLASSDVLKTNVTVGGDGTFGGTGLVMGNTTVTSGGTLAPGIPNAPGFTSTPGTLTLQGNLQFNPGSTYAVQLNPGATSLTTVSGTTTISSGAQAYAFFAPGIYTIGSKVRVLTSPNGLTGQFSALTQNTGYYNVRPVLSYDDENIYFTLLQAFLAPPPGTPRNGLNIANAINGAIAAGYTLPASFQNLFLLSPEVFAPTINSMGNQTGIAAAQGAIATMNSFLGLIFDYPGPARQQEAATAIGFAPERRVSPEVARAYAAVTPKDRLAAAAPLVAPTLPSWVFWGSTFGGVARLEGDALVGSQDVASNIFGTAVGADYRVFPNTKIGFALAGGETSFSLSGAFGSGRSDFFQGALYGKSYFGAGYVTGAVAGGTQWVKSDRTVILGSAVDSLTASYTLPIAAGRLESGYRFGAAQYGLTPYGAVQAQTAFIPGYVETATSGTGATANVVAAYDVPAVRSELGAWADTRLWTNSNILLRGRAAWVHEFIRDATVSAQFATLPGLNFALTGAQLPADAALLSGVVEIPITRSLTMSGKFDGEFGNGVAAWAGTGKIRWIW
jgi:subtilase-type serine protease